MATVEGRLWWYSALHQMVAEALKNHPRGKEARVVDAGCGTGGLLRFLAAQGYKNLSGFDLSPIAAQFSGGSGFITRNGDLRDLHQLVPSESADVIISNDTLYFFEPGEQEQIVLQCWEALAPGGLLILNLPALQAFRGIHDLAVGIQRRFSKADVVRLLPDSHFQLAEARFWPFLLSPIIYSVRSAQRLRLRLASECRPSSDTHLPADWLNKMFTVITALERNALPWTPFGSSLFVTASKVPEIRKRESDGLTG